MKPKELRIGNLVDYEKTTLVITSISGSGFLTSLWIKGKPNDMYSHYAAETSPIPINEEWLKKFGFTPYGDGIWMYGDHKLFNIWYNDGLVRIGGGSFFNAFQFPKEYSEVHKLQNLFFMAVGEELELKK